LPREKLKCSGASSRSAASSVPEFGSTFGFSQNEDPGRQDAATSGGVSARRAPRAAPIGVAGVAVEKLANEEHTPWFSAEL
jgi:hypothetical protein